MLSSIVESQVPEIEKLTEESEVEVEQLLNLVDFKMFGIAGIAGIAGIVEVTSFACELGFSTTISLFDLIV
jgi:hypothetical protein